MSSEWCLEKVVGGGVSPDTVCWTRLTSFRRVPKQCPSTHWCLEKAAGECFQTRSGGHGLNAMDATNSPEPLPPQDLGTSTPPGLVPCNDGLVQFMFSLCGYRLFISGCCQGRSLPEVHCKTWCLDFSMDCGAGRHDCMKVCDEKARLGVKGWD